MFIFWIRKATEKVCYIMNVLLKIPTYNGYSTPVIWEHGSKVAIHTDVKYITISGSKEAFFSIAKQFLFFYCNNVPSGSHVHYDFGFCRNNWNGPCLVIDFLDDRIDFQFDFDTLDPMVLALPDNINDISWDYGAKVAILQNQGEIVIRGNKTAFLCIAKLFLFLSSSNMQGQSSVSYDYPENLAGWEGATLRLLCHNRTGDGGVS